MSSRSPFVILTSAAVLTLLNAGSAHAEPVPAAMVLRGTTASEQTIAPPIGLLDFCEREPLSCAGPLDDHNQVIQSVARARGLAWREVLGGARNRVWPGSIEATRTMRVASATNPDKKFLGGLDVPGLQLSSDEAGKVAEINAVLNRTIIAASDGKLHGQQDFWTVPRPDNGGRLAGDCEDYVLAKREALLRLGIAPERLSIALARTPQGEDHAVLLLAYPDGDYVLDNRDSRVLHWSRASLDWQARQRPGELLQWVRL